jgi:hypothetical protein
LMGCWERKEWSDIKRRKLPSTWMHTFLHVVSSCVWRATKHTP